MRPLGRSVVCLLFYGNYANVIDGFLWCDQFEHFKTQLPYALMNGAIALGYFVVAGVTASALVVIFAVFVVMILSRLDKKRAASQTVVADTVG